MPLMSKLLPEAILTDMPRAFCNPYLDYDDPETTSIACLNGVTGEVLFKNHLPGSRRITRQKLRRVLINGVRVVWGKSLSQLSATNESVALTFQDGETIVADYVLGADGPTSKVRELLLGTEIAQTVDASIVISTAVVKYNDAGKVKALTAHHPVMLMYMGTTSTGGFGSMSRSSDYILEAVSNSFYTTSHGCCKP